MLYLCLYSFFTTFMPLPNPPAITVGDPHVATFDGCQYTFNGLGEYVITQVPGIATIQGRTKKTGKYQPPEVNPRFNP